VSRNIFSFDKKEFEKEMEGWGELSYRVDQVFDWIYKKLIFDPMQMTNLPIPLREKLKNNFSFDLPKIVSKVKNMNTKKYLMELEDGEKIETILMKHSNRRTICVSTQVGCSFSCGFCATGLIGLRRNLHAEEIVSQILLLGKELREENEKISNIVFMGMGEPLANYSSVIKALRIIHEDWGLNIGAKHITISTIGIVPKIYDLAKENLKVRLAISLHAPNNDLRDKVIPLNKEYPIEDLIEAAWFYAEKTGRRVTFEYVLIKDFNDKPEHARELITLLKGKPAHVNLIPWNRVSEYPWDTPRMNSIERFERYLKEAGLKVTLRRSYGSNIRAGCGQLRAVYLQKVKEGKKCEN